MKKTYFRSWNRFIGIVVSLGLVGFMVKNGMAAVVDSGTIEKIEIYSGTSVSASTVTLMTSDSPYSTLSGEEDGDESGRTLAAGDFNGDGKTDIAIGAPNAGTGDDEGDGKVYILYGALTTGLKDLGGAVELATVADAVIDAEHEEETVNGAPFNTQDGFGTSVAAGDFNGDGVDDLLVGAPGCHNYSLGYSALLGAGQAYLFLGSASAPWSGTVFAATASQRWDGYYGDKLGSVVASAGDMNKDGKDEIVIHAKGYSAPVSTYTAYAGKFYLIYGSSAFSGSETDLSSRTTDVCLSSTSCALITGLAGHASLSATYAAGDYDNDGDSDLLISWGDANTTYVLKGKSAKYTALTLADLATKYTNAGGAACVADLNGDGVNDVAVSNTGYGSGTSTLSGRVYFIAGSASGTLSKVISTTTLVKTTSGLDVTTSSQVSATFTGAGYDMLGNALSCADVNGDGASDLLIGASGYAGRPGAAYLVTKVSGFSGDTDISSHASVGKFSGLSSLAQLGTAVQLADLNKNGKAEVIVSATENYASTPEGPGHTYLFWGN